MVFPQGFFPQVFPSSILAYWSGEVEIGGVRIRFYFTLSTSMFGGNEEVNVAEKSLAHLAK